MQGLYYLLSLVAFGVIAAWLVQNDNLASGQATKGLLRMKGSGQASKSDTPKQVVDSLN